MAILSGLYMGNEILKKKKKERKNSINKICKIKIQSNITTLQPKEEMLSKITVKERALGGK